MKKLWITIYECKDENTPLGAVLYDGWADDLPTELKFPKLRDDWYWLMETMEKDDEKEN